MKKLISLSSFVLLLMLMGCSGGSDSASQEQARTINIIGIDKLKFVVAEKNTGLKTGEEITVNGNTYYLLKGINALTGEELTINLKTISNMQASAMSHNWLLLEMGSDPEAFTKASLQAKNNDYVAKEVEDQVITDTGLVPGGESASITFNAPNQPGEYDYICTFPGHFTAGMRGTLSVK